MWFYGDNDDFVGQKLSTDPMFELEIHLTRNFAKDLWGSADLIWFKGGQAKFNGVKGEEADRVGVGFTLGYHVTDHMQLTIGYMATVGDDKPEDLNMDRIQLSLVFGWHRLLEGMNRMGE